MERGKETCSKPARPVAKPAPAAVKPAEATEKPKEAAVASSSETVVPKKDTIVVDQPVTKEDVEKLGKEIDQISATGKVSDETSTNN